MLVLSRKPGEQVVIGPDIVVSVIECSAGGVRLGIEAPRSVRVHRQEVADRVLAENQRASETPPTLPDFTR